MMDLAALRQQIKSLPTDQQEHLLDLLKELEESEIREKAQGKFIEFVRHTWPAFIEGPHHRVVADAFDRIAAGELKRLMVFMPPRHTKSEFASYMLPAWFFGKFPKKKIIQASNNAELAVGFGRKVRNLVNSDSYKIIFPETSLSADSKAAGRWNTNHGGEYFAVGVSGILTGRGADLLIIDDPHALHVDTPIATTEGWKTIGTVNVGDEVFGPDGLPTKVVAKSDVYKQRDLYAVMTSDGETIFADAKHLWNVRTSTRINDSYRNITTDKLVDGRSSAFMIPRHAAVHYPERDLPIDPWVLGAWLGDGTSSLGRMTAHPDDMPYMRGEFRRRGYVTTDLADTYSFGVSGLLVQLRELSVLNNKHIPEIYLTASYMQRMSLLQGLMDTDGNVTTNGQCVFHNKDEHLVDQVVELVRSFGRKCQRRTYHVNGKFGACIMHRVTFKMEDAALMPRKRIRTRHTDDKQHRSITVDNTGISGDVQCITVDREDGLFLAGRGYVVTHNSEQEAALNSSAIYDTAYEWYTSGPRQRLQPGGAIVVVVTRWSKIDLPGRIIKSAVEREEIDEWEIIELPAILDENTDDERPVWPGFWSIEELKKVRAELPVSKWQAQYQQKPTSEEGAIIKREWWNKWEQKKPPECEFVIQCWDTALTAKETSDYSACSTWGVWYTEDGRSNIILLDAYQARIEFPELKSMAVKKWNEYRPDSLIVEGRASGTPLIQELRRTGIPVVEYTPASHGGRRRGSNNDKVARMNSISDIFMSGHVWYPAGKRFAEEMIEEAAEFPFGEHDDLVDTMIMAVMRYREGGFISLHSDMRDEEDLPRRVRRAYY